MSTVRINDNIKKEVTPILDDLGLSLSEAINIFLHQVKIYNGIPFKLKRNGTTELNDGNGSYVCEYGNVHDYSKISKEEIEKELNDTTVYNTIDDLMNELKEE